MTKDVVQDAIYWLNSFHSYNWVSDTLSLDKHVQGLPNPVFDNLTVDFGSYTQVCMGNNNTNKLIKIGAIFLWSAVEHNGY